MDISTMIVDLLRGSKEEALLNQGGPIANSRTAPGPAKAPGTDLLRNPEAAAAISHLADPHYTAYKREAQASGEPVMSMEEFKKAQGRR